LLDRCKCLHLVLLLIWAINFEDWRTYLYFTDRKLFWRLFRAFFIFLLWEGFFWRNSRLWWYFIYYCLTLACVFRRFPTIRYCNAISTLLVMGINILLVRRRNVNCGFLNTAYWYGFELYTVSFHILIWTIFISLMFSWLEK